MGPQSGAAGAQISFLPRAYVAMASGIIVYRLTNEEDYRRIQALWASFRKIPFDEIANLPDGVAYVAFHHVSDPKLRGKAFKVRLRPTATWAGGETLSAV